MPSENQSALKNEGAIVQALGLRHYHIPVDWAAPKDSDFAAFDAALQATSADKVLIHCAANFRVTAFYSLYALKHLGWTAEQAGAFRAVIWQDSDYPVWTNLSVVLPIKFKRQEQRYDSIDCVVGIGGA